MTHRRRPPRVVLDLGISTLGSVAPAIIGVLSTGVIVACTDSANGVLILAAWSLVGYLSLTDFGLTRAASKMTSEGKDRGDVIAGLWRVSLVLGACFAATTLLFVLLTRADRTLLWLVVVPVASALQFPVMGALEATGRFGILARQRLINAVAVYLVPAVMVAVLQSSYAGPAAIIVISGYRVATFLRMSRKLQLPVRPTLRRALGAPSGRPLSSGHVVSWVGLSSVIGPLMLYGDRLALAFAGLPAADWVLYVSVSEILLKTYVLPNAALAVVYPWLTRNIVTRRSWVRRAFLGLLPGATLLAVAAFAGAGLLIHGDLRIGGVQVESLSARWVVVSLLVGTVVNWSSQALIGLLHVLDRQRFVAMSQLALAVPYYLLLGVAVMRGGAVVTVAAIWSSRIMLTWVALYAVSVRCFPRRSPMAATIPTAAELRPERSALR